MSTFGPRLLTPPPQEEETYPYRRVWRSIILENGVLLAVIGAILVFFYFLGFQLPENILPALSLGVAILPFVLWLVFSWWQERFALQPRSRLLAVAIITALAANAVGIPLVDDFLQVDRWLPLSSAINRIVGYTFTVGIVQETIKYLVLRYTVWPGDYRVRLDGVAYGAASAIGYATVLNLHYVASNAPLPDAAAGRVFATVALHLVTSVIVGYGLAELRCGRPTPLLLMVTVALAAAMHGIAVPVRAGLVSASLGLGNSLANPLLGLGFSIALLVVPLFILSFLYESAERKSLEAVGEDS